MDPKDRITIDPDAQAALEALIEKERRKKFRRKFLGILGAVFLILVLLPYSLNFYCAHIIGTNYETIIAKRYPQLTGTIVRAAVITDRFYMDALKPFPGLAGSRQERELRSAVIELGLEMTEPGTPAPEKILSLREIVGSSIEKAPATAKKGLAFAVYELPPKGAQPQR